MTLENIRNKNKAFLNMDLNPLLSTETHVIYRFITASETHVGIKIVQNLAINLLNINKIV